MERISVILENLPYNPRDMNDTQVPDSGLPDQQTANPPTSCRSHPAPSSPSLSSTGINAVQYSKCIRSTHLLSYLLEIIEKPENVKTLK